MGRLRRRAALLRRALTVAAVLAGEGWRIAWPLAAALRRADAGARDRLLGAAAAASATRLGPCFVKVAQMFSYRSDLFSADFLAPLAGLQDDVRYRGRPDDVALCLAQLAGYAPGLEVEPSPAGAGSVALVFKGRLAGAATAAVAVKVVRPWVPAALAQDCALLRSMVALLARHPSWRALPLLALFDQVASMVCGQVDMTEEGRVLERMGARACGERVRVPRRMPGFAPHPHILVMEWVDAQRPLRSAHLPDREFRQAARALLRRLYRMIFVDGLVHCDLHPGNVLSDGGAGITLVDVGLSVQLSESDRIAFRNFFAAFVLKDVGRCSDAIIRSAVLRPGSIDLKCLRADVQALLGRHHGRLAGDFLVVGFVRDIFALQRRHRLYGAPGFVAAIWALAMYEGLVRERYADLDFQAEARPHVVSDWIAYARVQH